MKLQPQGGLCACALFLALTVLQLGTALAQDSSSGEKKKQYAVKWVRSAQPSTEPVTEAAKGLARTMQGCIGAGLTKESLKAQRGPMSKKNVLGMGARFAVNDGKADGSSPVGGRVLTPAGDLYVSYIPTADGVVGIIEASTRLPTKSKADKKRRSELNVVGFRLNKVVEFYQFAFWPKRSSVSLATLVSGAPEFVSNGVSPSQAAKLLSAPKKNAKKDPTDDGPGGIPADIAWKCGTGVDPGVLSPPSPSGGGAGSACNAPTMADLAGCSAIMCTMPPPGVQPPPGTGCCCADASGGGGNPPGGGTGGGGNSNGNGGEPGTGCPDGKPKVCAMRFDGGPGCWCEGTGGENPPGSGTGGGSGNGGDTGTECPDGKPMICAKRFDGGPGCWCQGSEGGGENPPGGETGGGDPPPVRDGDTTSCRPEEMVCVKPAPGVNYTGPDCYCPGQRSGSDPQPGITDPEPITAPGFIVDPLDPSKKMGNDPWCKPSCGDGVCTNTSCTAQGCACPESPETCPGDCKSEGDSSDDPDEPHFGVAPFCGNGQCEDVTCMAIGCPEPETAENCEVDCGRSLGVDPPPSYAP